MSRYTGNMTQQESNHNNSNVEAVVEILLTRLQAMEEKIKSQEEEIKRLRNKNQKKIKTSSKTQINNERPMLFGTIDGDFSEDKLIQLREDNDIDGIKKYITAYYAKVLDAHFVVKYCKTENKYDFIDDYIFKTKILKPLEIKYLDEQGRKSKYNFIDWFYSFENPGYKLITDPNKPRVFKHDGVRYLNLIYDQLHIHKEKKSLDSYPEKIKLRVQHVWKHIKEAWCSGKQDQFEYIQKWISHVVSGRKMRTCLYLTSVQGIGKSIIIKFLSEQVLGNELVYSTSDVSSLVGRFNAPLVGRVLFVLEEAPCGSTYDWKVLENRLKNYITENMISIERKGQDPIKVKNTVSFIINTNNYAIRISYDDRRYFQPDTSDKYKGNKEYFNKLIRILEDPNVGEAFYMNCIEIAEANKDFNEEHDRPRTEKIDENIADNVPSTFRFIKEAFIMKKKGIDMKFKDLYDKYLRFCESNKIQCSLHKLAFAGELKKVKINYIQSSTKHHNANWVENTYDQLVNIFLKARLMKEEELGDVEEEKEIPTVGEAEQKVIEDYIENKEEKNEVIEDYNEEQQENKIKVGDYGKSIFLAIKSCPPRIRAYKNKKSKNEQPEQQEENNNEEESDDNVKVINKMKIN
jgi:hypothetical protein